MRRFFKNIKKYFKYALRSAKAELKSEVADSYLNWLWWVIEPFCFMLIYTFVFGVIFKNNTPYFASFVFVGLSAWDFFNRMIKGSVNLITSNRDLVTKVYIPKYILLFAKSFTYLFKMFISLAIAFVLMLYQGVPLSLNLLWIVPIIIVLYIFTFGLGMILMHLGVTLSDLSNLTNIMLRMIFYLSGVFYNIGEKLGKTNANLAFLLIRLNPIAFIMNELREALIFKSVPNLGVLGIWFVISILLCIIGIHVIHKNENSYAKVI